MGKTHTLFHMIVLHISRKTSWKVIRVIFNVLFLTGTYMGNTWGFMTQKSQIADRIVQNVSSVKLLSNIYVYKHCLTITKECSTQT